MDEPEKNPNNQPVEPQRRFRRLIAASDDENPDSTPTVGPETIPIPDEESQPVPTPGQAETDQPPVSGPANMGEPPEALENEHPQDAPDPAQTLVFPAFDSDEPPVQAESATQALETAGEPETGSATSGLSGTMPPTDTPAPEAPAQPPNVNRRATGSHRPGRTPPAVDSNGMPLPHRVDEIDPYATRVTPSAYRASPRATGATRLSQKTANHHTQPVKVSVEPTFWGRTAGCLVRLAIGLVFVAVVAALAAGSFGVYQYYRIAATLPSVADLQQHASQFETTRILDRNGNSLYEILDPNAGRRTYVPLDKISPYLIAATIATEDKEFYVHPGFDPIAILQALYQNYVTGGNAGGASTVTQQLARALLLSPEERTQRTIQRKAREIVLAAEITRRYSKEQILEIYLNEIYYGNLAYGIEAAAETYFQTSADRLTLAQAAFLAGLPQAPSVYDIYNNRDDTLNRLKQVLVLIYQDSQEKNCIEVSTSQQPVCVDAAAVAEAATTIESYEFKKPAGDIHYPHWVNYVRALLEQQYDPQTIYRSGFTVYTTLDPALQDKAEQIVREQVASLADRHVTDGALVAIRPGTGEILSMVGSADFYNDAIAGQVNMAVSPRQPGSSIKPLTYVAAFEKGWTPATLLWDVPTAFPPSGDPNDPRPAYEPRNYDDRFHGPVTVRAALANSYNIPAVKALYYIGVYGNADNANEGGLINMAKRMGITSLTRPDYGLALTLGGGDVSLLEMTGAYAIFATGGQRIPPVAITKIVDHDGKVVYEYHVPEGEQVIRAEHAFLISSILSDNTARTPMFGANSVLNLPFQAAVKTGTTNDYRDNWTVGYTPDLTVGVWVGNADYTPMHDTSGVTGAAPIWAKFMQEAIQSVAGGNPSPFIRPAGVIERVICADSGTEPSDRCPEQRSEFFASDQPPLSKDEDLWKKASIDTWTGLSASPACADFVAEKMVINVKDQTAVRWIKDTKEGQAWAESKGFSQPFNFVPERACKADDPRPTIGFSGLSDGQTIVSNPLDIMGVADAPADFEHFRLEYGIGDDPSEWKPIVERSLAPVKQTDKLGSWDLKDVPAGRVTLRLHLETTTDRYADKKIRLNIQVPTPTATPTATMTATPTFTSTPTMTATVPTATPTNTPVPPTATPVPPTATETIPPPTETFFPLSLSETPTPSLTPTMMVTP